MEQNNDISRPNKPLPVPSLNMEAAPGKESVRRSGHVEIDSDGETDDVVFVGKSQFLLFFPFFCFFFLFFFFSLSPLVASFNVFGTLFLGQTLMGSWSSLRAVKSSLNDFFSFFFSSFPFFFVVQKKEFPETRSADTSPRQFLSPDGKGKGRFQVANVFFF
jgi:hypothetical protein